VGFTLDFFDLILVDHFLPPGKGFTHVTKTNSDDAYF
jgi:response regulator of citrate/malate metabolism